MARRRAHKKRTQQTPTQKRRSARWAVAAAVLLIILLVILSMPSNEPIRPSAPRRSEPPPSFSFSKEGELAFLRASGDSITVIDIEIAGSSDERSMGLMYRTSLELNQGMLFIFPLEEVQSFWMKNTSIPLDILFVNSRNEIVTIHEQTEPFSSQSYSSEVPVLFVVEVPAGFIAMHGIQNGDLIRWKRSDL